MRCIIGAVSLLAAFAAGGAAPDPVAARVAAYHELGSAFKNVNDGLKAKTPNLYVLQLSARQIRDAARAQYGWFPAGSGPAPGVKTRAKPEIWAQPDDFKSKQDAFAVEANALFAATSASDLAAMRARAKTLGAACGACHKVYRAEEKK
ncbi:MAG: cytochrome c [Parvularculaceae bacterium]|nr:cytochrome c [Parvularculaceae bacterium]